MSADTGRRVHLPGEAGIWVFVFGDLVIFGVLFGTYMFYRADDTALYLSSQRTLNQNFGALNTLLLLTSSWFVARGVAAVRLLDTRAAPWRFALAWACGAGFAVDKVLEYREKLAVGITPATNDFYMYYYVLTGIHFVHLLVGMGLLAYLWALSRRPAGEDERRTIESGATFWHLVDLLWIILFPMLYLLR